MATYNDGNVPFGSQVITASGNSFVAENINLDQPTTVIERRNEVGDPSGQVIIANFSTGSATLQLATTSSVIPTNGSTFSLTKPGTPASTVNCIISQVGTVLNQADAKKVNINFRVAIN